MTKASKVNLFEQFDAKAEKSSGLQTIERTKITLTSEQRTKRMSITVTPSEFKEIRRFSRDLEEETDTRATISDLTRDLWLILLGKDEEHGPYHEHLKELLKERLS